MATMDSSCQGEEVCEVRTLTHHKSQYDSPYHTQRERACQSYPHVPSTPANKRDPAYVDSNGLGRYSSMKPRQTILTYTSAAGIEE